MLRGIGIEAGGQQEDGVEIGDGFTLPPLVVEGLCGGEETQAVGVVAGRTERGGAFIGGGCISGDGFTSVAGMTGDEAQW